MISDNVLLVKEFRNIISSRRGYLIDYFFSWNNRTPVGLRELGCRPINVKKDWKRIGQEYSLVFSLHCKQIFPEELVLATKCYNLHPGLNPFNRGWYPQVFSIINKLPLGATLHEMDAQVDNGGIIDQESVAIDACDTSFTAYDKVQSAEIRILERSLEKILTQQYTLFEHGTGNYNSMNDYKQLLKLDLDKSMTVREVLDLLRALTHPPFKNAYFIDPDTQTKCYVEIRIEKA